MTMTMFEAINPVFQRLDASAAAAQARKVASADATAASKSARVVAGNPVFTVENTALRTLAVLGGDDFKAKYNIR